LAEERTKIPPIIGEGPKNTSAARAWVWSMRRGERPEAAGGWRDPAMAVRAHTRDD
jgi:hypothetical protein